MKAREEYKIRLEMSKMHEVFIEQMSTAYDNKCYVETVWYCYAIFEQRINRLISKYIDKCKAPKERIDKKTVSISTRINCLKQLSKSKYGAFDEFDYKLLVYIQEWCNERNELVHGLVSLKYYKEYDKEFTKLAEKGVPLVFELYDACTDFRQRWKRYNEPTEDFPVKCKCKKKKCINPNCI